MVAEQSSDGGISFKRDRVGRLLEAVVEESRGPDVVTRFERDAFGRLTAEEQDGERIVYSLDERGRRASRQLPASAGGALTQYAYDAFGAFSSLEHDGAKVEVSRDALGRESSRRFGEQLEQTRRYDLLDRLVDQTVRRPGIGGQAPTDVVSPTSIDDGRWGRTVYSYDPLGQLLSAKRGGHHEVFDYDVTGSLQNVLSQRLCPLAHVELHALGERQIAAPVHRAGLAAHVGLPGVGPRLATAAGFLLATEGPADLGTAGADVDVGDAAVGAFCRQELLGRAHAVGEHSAR